jgi:pimeloyl-ACP methyl ester carboxylesterase
MSLPAVPVAPLSIRYEHGALDALLRADDVLAVIDRLELNAIVLVGHSYGAHVVIDVAARRPDVVRRLVLVDPPGDFTRVPNDVRDGELLPYLAKLEGDGWRDTVGADFAQANKGGTSASGAAVQARLATMPRHALTSMFRSMMAYPASASLERYLAHPDREVRAILAPPNAWPFSLHNLVPAVRAGVVPDVGHWIMLDTPERFVAELETAIAGT